MSNYFTLFHLPTQFSQDNAQLEATYRQLAAHFHPDKTAAASAFEQKQAVMMSATINQAYQILKNPIDRAAYLLEQHGIHADAPEHTQLSAEFLMQQMQWREQLMEAKMEQDEAALLALQQEIESEQQNLFTELEQAFKQEKYDHAAELVRQGRFLNKIQQEIQAAL
ncbi:Fe-S protein assembly co-chaperone HscB [Neisseriaceae bacterium B1]